MCAIFTVLGWRKLGNTGKKWLSFRFSDTAEGFSEGLEPLQLKDRARASQSPLSEDSLPISLHRRGIHVLDFSAPQFLLKGAIYQTLCQSCTGTPQPRTAFPGGFVSLALKLTLGPQTQELWIETKLWIAPDGSCVCPHTGPCLFRSSLLVSCLHLFFPVHVHFRNDKTPELVCWAGLSLLLSKNK